MKKILLAGLAFTLFLTSCKKDSDDESSNSSSNEINREQITEGNYDPNETPIERYLRIMRIVSGSQTPSESSNARLTEHLKTNNDICDLIEDAYTTGPTSETCFTKTAECRESGAWLKTVYDYHDGCDAGDEILTGQLITTVTRSLTDPYAPVNSEYQFVNFGGINEPKMNATGTQVTVIVGGASKTTTEADYIITSGNEVLTLDLEAVSYVYSAGNMEGSYVYHVVSDRGYTLDIKTTTNFKTSSSCVFNQETIPTYPIVSGVEEATLIQDDFNHTYIINMGDGTCDEIYTITDEDNNVVTITSDYYIQ